NIQEVETSRYYKSIQDNIDHDNYVRDEWAKTSADLFRERALWGPKTSDHESKWRLDFTEVPVLRTVKYDRCFNALTNIKFNDLIDLDVPVRHLGGKSHDRQMTLTPSASDAETSNDDVDSVEN
ncbi:5589_t:CDS:2, partial [Racocetra fulgida]